MRPTSPLLAALPLAALLLAGAAAAQAPPDSALVAAAQAGDAAAIDAALAAGASADAADADGATALLWAVYNGHADAARRLVAAGADVAPRPGAIYFDAARSGYVASPLTAAAGLGRPDLVAALLGAGADPDAFEWDPAAEAFTGWTPVQWAAVTGHVQTLRPLLAAGADADRTAPGRATALAMARLDGRDAVAAALREGGARDAVADRHIPRPLAPGSEASGEFDADSATLPNGRPYRLFSLTLPPDAPPFELVVTADGFDPFLSAAAPSGVGLANDDWQGSLTESRVVVEAPEAGAWSVRVSAIGEGGGPYALAHRPLDPAEAAALVAAQDADARQRSAADSLAARAVARYAAGDFAEARRLTLEELALREAAGARDVEVANSLSNLAVSLSGLGLLAEAEAADRRALALREAALGPDHVDTALSLSNLGGTLLALGRYAEAEALQRRALAVRESLLGPDDPAVANSLNNLATVLVERAAYAEAERLHLRALAIREGALGPEASEVATSLGNLAAVYAHTARYGEALALARRALATRTAADGPGHPQTALAHLNLAAVLDELGRYAEAEAELRRAVAIADAALGPGHPDAALARNNLALVLDARGRPAEATRLLRGVVAAQRAALGPDHPAVAVSLNNLGALLAAQGRAAGADSAYARALGIAEAAFGADHPATATALANLGVHRLRQARFGEARDLLTRALAIARAALGDDHPDTVGVLANLAAVDEEEGRFEGAEARRRGILAAVEAARGADHPATAYALTNLAGLLATLGRTPEAERLLRRAVAVSEAALGPDHPDTATALNNLGALYIDAARYAEAEPLLRRALAAAEAARGPGHPDAATGLNNLATLLGAQGRYAEAEALAARAAAAYRAALGDAHPDVAVALSNLASARGNGGRMAAAAEAEREALAIREAALGPDHPAVAASLSNLAAYAEAAGDDPEPLLRRALAIAERAFGPEHPAVAQHAQDLAGHLLLSGDPAAARGLSDRAVALRRALLGDAHPDLALSLAVRGWIATADGRPDAAQAAFREAAAIERTFIATVLPASTERETQAFLRTRISSSVMLSAALRPDAPAGAARDAFDQVLHRKALRLDATARRRSRVLDADDPEAARLAAELHGVSRRIAELTFAGPAGGPDEHRARMDALYARRESVEDRLAQRSAGLAGARAPARADADAVARLLPARARLVEYVRFRPLDFGAADSARVRGAARYAAFVLGPAGGPRLVDLGAAAPIDALAQRFRERIDGFDPGRLGRRQRLRQERLLARTTAALHAALLAPLALPDGGPLYVSPDGALHGLPFAILPDAEGRRADERHRVSLLTSGRDLVRLDARPEAPPGELVVFAGVDYAAGGGLDGGGLDGAGSDAGAAPELRPALRSGRSARIAAQLGRFDALPGTDREAAALAGLAESSRLVLGADATEAALLAVERPWRLHIATHGFFLRPDAPAGAADEGLRGGTAGAPLQAVASPLLRSGLALAGANGGRDDAGGDGIATAFELSGLDLRGTDMVVLSACETGLGEIEAGEGVLGLRRAFELAGAETVVMSLWKVPDAATTALMTAFYEGLGAGLGKAEALRAAAATVRARPEWSHPYWWGAFVLAGDAG